MDTVPIPLAEVFRRLGRVHVLQGRPRDAAHVWRQALALDPGDTELISRLCALEKAIAGEQAAVSLPPARLLVLHSSEEVEEFPIRRCEVLLGGGPETDLRLRGEGIAPLHARLAYRNGRFWIEDLGSAGGIQLEGEPMREPCPLEHGATLRIGSCYLRFMTSR